MIALYGENRFYRHVASHWIEMQQALIAMIIGGVFEFHPKLRVGFLEAQNSWVPGLLSRIEWDYPQYRDSHAPYLAADAARVLPAQLLGRGGGQRAGDRGHGRAHRRRPHVHLHRLPALRLQLPARVGEPAEERAARDRRADLHAAARVCTASPRGALRRADAAAARIAAATLDLPGHAPGRRRQSWRRPDTLAGTAGRSARRRQ